MFQWLLWIFSQIREAHTEGGIRNLLHKRIYWQRIAIPVEMNLSEVPSISSPLYSAYTFIEINSENLQKLVFTQASRHFKARISLKKGWRGFCIIKDYEVIGEIWCITPDEVGHYVVHPDLKLLDIQINEKDAYAFDMYMNPAYRGKNLAVPFMRSLHSTLRNEGFQKVYGFYWDDNLPALWMHRMLMFKELAKRRISRLFFIQFSKPHSLNNHSKT